MKLRLTCCWLGTVHIRVSARTCSAQSSAGGHKLQQSRDSLLASGFGIPTVLVRTAAERVIIILGCL